MEPLECYEASATKRGAYTVTSAKRSSALTVIALLVAVVGVCLGVAALVKVQSTQQDVDATSGQVAASSDPTASQLQQEFARVAAIISSSAYCKQNATTWKSCMDTIATADNIINNLHGASEPELVDKISKGMHIVGNTEVRIGDAHGFTIASYNSDAQVGEASPFVTAFNNAQADVQNYGNHIIYHHASKFYSMNVPVVTMVDEIPLQYNNTYGRRNRRCWCLIGSCCNSGGDNSMLNGNSVSLIPK